MRTLYDRTMAALQQLAAVLLALMLLLVLAGVFYRYVFDDSLSWYDEFAGYLLVWLTMVGSVVGLAKGSTSASRPWWSPSRRAPGGRWPCWASSPWRPSRW
jgi:Tripartite ATP-independent periplasmic transporters, DctQ component